MELKNEISKIAENQNQNQTNQTSTNDANEESQSL